MLRQVGPLLCSHTRQKSFAQRQTKTLRDAPSVASEQAANRLCKRKARVC
jgi:hypothetical protein